MNREQVPKEMQPVYDAVAGLIDSACVEVLNTEYRALCLRATAVLCRKRPSPLLRGKLDVWACGIVYAMGQVNFLFDSSQKPHVSAGDLCKMFGVSKSTGSAKARDVSRMLRTYPMDPHWSVPSRLDDNPLAWLIKVDGYCVDARRLSRSVQELAFHAFQQGLIPYIPLDRPK